MMAAPPSSLRSANEKPSQVVTVASMSSTVALVSNFWKDFDLEGLRGKLDEEGMQIADNQEASVKKRKELAEATREFKKKKDFTQKEVGNLLRSYQEEIDRITKRAKFGEAAFLELYQRLYEAPDPAPVLAGALETISRSADLEAQTRKMAQELADYKAESHGIKNQGVTIKKLEEKARTLQASLEEKDRQLSEAHAQAIQAADEQATQEMQEREEALSLALAEAQANLRKIKEAQLAAENRLFQVTSQTESEAAGMNSELESVTEAMERAEQRYASLQHEKAATEAQMKRLQERGESDELALQRQREESLRKELSVQRERASCLKAELGALQREKEAEQASYSSRLAMQRTALEAQERRSSALEHELACRPSADELESLRQQVRTLQAVGFGEVDSNEHGDAGGVGSQGTLEAMLLEKNRKLEHQFTRCKLELADLRGSLEANLSQITELELELERKNALVEQLEEAMASLDSSDLLTRSGELSGTKRVDSGIPLLDEDEGEQTMVAAVCQQRDRYRKRCIELEEAVANGVNAILAAQSDLQAAKADNVALIERMRFQQGYKPGDGAGPKVSSVGDVESRYAKEYEEQLNPFNQFQTKQKDARRKKLTVADKAVLNAGSLIFGNKYARLFVFLYTVLLHTMIFFTMFRMSHVGHHVHAKTEALCSKEIFLSAVASQNNVPPEDAQLARP